MLALLVVWCLCRQVFSHGFFISCHLPAEPNQPISVLTFLFHSPWNTPLWILSPQAPAPTPISPVVVIIFQSSIQFSVHIHHPFACFSPHTPSLFSASPPPSWIIFGPGLLSFVLFIPCPRIVACRPPEPLCVVCSRTGAARAKCQAPSCCLHLPQWPAQCPSLCPTLNPTARPLMADSPRPHLCVSDPLQRLSEPNHSQKSSTNNNQKFPGLSSENTPAIVLLPTPCHCSSCVSNISPPETTGRLVQNKLWHSAGHMRPGDCS